ncbi:MAG: helix-turn-helix domain-containing protein [Anaerolineae bacterium]
MNNCSQTGIWFDIEGAMEYLKISRTTLYAAMKDGRLKFYYVKGTRQRRLHKEDLDALLIEGSSTDLDDIDTVES